MNSSAHEIILTFQCNSTMICPFFEFFRNFARPMEERVVSEADGAK